MMLAIQYNFAIYSETAFGEIQYQAHGLAGGDWLPVAPPTDSEEKAKFDAYDAHKELAKRGFAMESNFKLDPQLRRHDWSGTRRILK